MKKLIEQFNYKGNFKKHIITAFIVGVVLNIINQWDAVITFDLKLINFLQLVLTFIVPFTVSVYSASVNSKT